MRLPARTACFPHVGPRDQAERVTVLLSVLAAVMYGSGDFCGGLATRRSAVTSVVIVSQLVGIVVVVPALALLGGRPDPASLGWGVAGGLVGAVGVALFYGALARGTMSVVAPVTGVMATVVPVAAGLVLGERPGALVLVGVLLAVVAIVFVSAEGGRIPSPRTLVANRGVTLALVAGAAFGLLFVLLSRTAAESGLWPLLSARIASVSGMVVVALLLRRPVVPARPAWGLVLLAGIGDMGANILFLLAQRSGLLVVASVLTDLYPAATVLLARVVLHERLAPVQLGGVVAAGAAVTLITLG